MIFTCYQKCIFHKKDYLNRISFKYPVPAKRHDFSQIICLLGMSCNIFSLKKYVKWYCAWTAPETWAVKYTLWKVSKYGFFFCPYFPVFGQNTKIYINVRIQSEYRKIRNRKKSVHGHFSCTDNVQKLMFRSSLLLLSFCWIFICLTLLCYTMEISNVKFYTFMQGNAFLFDKDAARIFLLFNYKFFAALFNSFKWHQLLFDFCKWCG